MLGWEMLSTYIALREVIIGLDGESMAGGIVVLHTERWVDRRLLR